MVHTRSAPDSLSAHQIRTGNRFALLTAGLASWVTGGVAAFQSGNGVGAAALVTVGAACGGLALIGRWPSRISMSGNELAWEDVKETVDSQIEEAETAGEDASVLSELKDLRERLDFLQRTGSVARHPAEVYDEAVAAAIRRLLPEAELAKQERRSRASADFILRYRGNLLSLETKWRADADQPYAGRTLPKLFERIAPDSKLLVVVNAQQAATQGAGRVIADALGVRGAVAGWRDVRDDGELGRVMALLLDSGMNPQPHEPHGR